jgi:catechol 2,3-dioxygenase-like lactoylglutathione lyase family enzyme
MGMEMDSFDHIFIAPKNFDKSLDFYSKILKWPIITSWGGNRQPRGAILKSHGGMILVLAEPHDDSIDEAWKEGRVSHQPTIHLMTDDLISRFKEIPPGSHVVILPERTHWGTHWFVLRDPDNNLIAFNSPQNSEPA